MRIRRYIKDGEELRDEIICESYEEEEIMLSDCYDQVLRNPRWFLDNLDNISDFSLQYKRRRKKNENR